VITVRKLMSLSPAHRARKAAQTLEHIERAYRAGDFSAAFWVQELVTALDRESDPALDTGTTASKVTEPAAVSALSDPWQDIRRVNTLRRSLELLGGRSPSDWDLLEPLGLNLDVGKRSVFPGMRAFLEDIRSPFNVGSMFRTADAFGVAELLLSSCCADPGHPRAQRSAMGASTLIPWRRAELVELPEYGQLFALELRGEPIEAFEFPVNGMVVLGSEELGVSPEALGLCERRVSIPMLGAKGSLNVGVAFGVLLAAWAQQLRQRGLQPVPPCPQH
jgi:RNA methyltransferase, TrmH family